MATKPASPPRFMMLGKSKYVHVVRTKTADLKVKDGSTCPMVRKAQVANTVPKGKGLSPEAASALDPCPNCGAEVVIKRAMPEEVTKQQKRDQRDDVIQRAKDSTKTKGQLKKATKAKEGKAPKDRKPPKATKSGPRSTGGDDDKANALVMFAKDHGWSAMVVDGEPGALVEAKRGEEVVKCYFVDGKYDTVRFATLTVGDWSGKLRGVHSCRRQIAGEGRDRPYPNPGQGRSGPRRKAKDEPDIPEDESPEDAKRRVPFMLDDDAIAIIDAIKGHEIRWRNGVSGTLDSARLPADPAGKKMDKIIIEDHPKTPGRRIVTFMEVEGMGEHGEVYGPWRSVALEKIVRVKA